MRQVEIVLFPTSSKLTIALEGSEAFLAQRRGNICSFSLKTDSFCCFYLFIRLKVCYPHVGERNQLKTPPYDCQEMSTLFVMLSTISVPSDDFDCPMLVLHF